MGWAAEAAKTFGMQTGQGIIGGVMGNIFGKMQDKRQLELQRKMQNMQEAGNLRMLSAQEEKEMRMWEKTNYSAQKEQMKKAGLSPGMLYGMSGGGGVTVGGSGPGVSGGSAGRGGEEATLASTGMGMNLQLMEAQRKNIEASTKKMEVEAAKTAGVDTKNVETQTLDLLQGIENKKAQEQLTKVQTGIANFDKELKGKTLDDMEDLARWTAENAKFNMEMAEREAYMQKATYQTKIDTVREELQSVYLRNALTKVQKEALGVGMELDRAQMEKIDAEVEAIRTGILQKWTELGQDERKTQMQERLVKFNTAVSQRTYDNILKGVSTVGGVLSGKGSSVQNGDKTIIYQNKD